MSKGADRVAACCEAVQTACRENEVHALMIVAADAEEEDGRPGGTLVFNAGETTGGEVIEMLARLGNTVRNYVCATYVPPENQEKIRADFWQMVVEGAAVCEKADEAKTAGGAL